MENKNLTNHHDLISLASLWHRWWEIFSTRFLFWIFLSFVPWFLTYLISVLILGKFVLALNSAATLAQLIGWQSSTLYFIVIGLILIIILQTFSSLIMLVGVINHRKLNTKSILAQAVKLFWPYVGLVIILSLISLAIVTLSYLLITLLSIIVGLININIIDNAFIWLNLIPLAVSLIVSVYLFCAPYNLIEKNKSIWDSVKQSLFLVRGHFWPVAIRLIIAYVVLLTLILILNLTPWVGAIAAIILASPALVIYIYLLYNDLASIKKN